MMELVLGTAQLGMSYGIANKDGQPDSNQVTEILNLAVENNLLTWDTAPVYGNSEEAIGHYIVKHKCTPVICTKLPSLSKSTINKNDLSAIRAFVNRSLQATLSALALASVDTYYIHDESDLGFGNENLLQVFAELKADGLINRAGISVYTPEIALSALATEFFDAIQVPYNLFDRRFQPIMASAKEQNMAVHVRSVFLQGLFFLAEDIVNQKVPSALPYVIKLKELAQAINTTTEQLAMGYVKANLNVSHLLIGVEKASQLQTNINLFSLPPLEPSLLIELENIFMNIPISVVNPSLWRMA